MKNKIKTVIYLGFLTGLLLFLGEMIGGKAGLTIALIIAGIINLSSYWFSDKIVLSMYRAKPLKENEAPEIHRIVQELSQNAGIPKPRVYYIDSPSPNAFATGRNPENGVVCITTGIVEMLTLDELKGVLAHEISHIKHRDTLISAVSATIAGAIVFLARMLGWAMIFGGRDDDDGGGFLGAILFMFLAPIAAMLIQLAISRSREFMADEEGAKISKSPLSLAKALEKLSYGAKKIPLQGANETTSHFFIVNPLSGAGLSKLFSTHPPIEERVKRLKKIARELGEI